MVVKGADLEALTKRLEELSNLSWTMSASIGATISQAESIVMRLEQNDVPEVLQIELIGELNQLTWDLSMCEQKIEHVL